MRFDKNVWMVLVSTLKEAVKWCMPYRIVVHYKTKRKKTEERKRLEEKNEIMDYFLSLNRDKQDVEVLEIIQYFERNPFSIFPYDFTKKYRSDEIEVFVDKSCKMRYVLHDNKRLYFPKHLDSNAVRFIYNHLCIEQDIDSPHRYETPDYTVKEGDVIADIGTAEGNWALNYAEKAGKIYLFECEQMWIEALKKTFEPWKDKVFIINKYVSNVSEGENITLDDFIKNDRIDFIKADIEGAEIQLLEGAQNVLSTQNNLKLLLCTYHRKDDEIRLKEILESKNFITEYSKRYMLFCLDKEIAPPYIRRGLIRAMKAQSPLSKNELH
jgi:hypothetical protein